MIWTCPCGGHSQTAMEAVGHLVRCLGFAPPGTLDELDDITRRRMDRIILQMLQEAEVPLPEPSIHCAWHTHHRVPIRVVCHDDPELTVLEPGDLVMIAGFRHIMTRKGSGPLGVELEIT